MAKGGLKEWFKQNWVDIGSKKKGGGFAKCGRSKLKADRKRKYPKCVPAAKAARMTESQIRSAVKRKRSKPQGVGGKPTNVKTFAKAAGGGMAVRGMKFIGVRCPRKEKTLELARAKNRKEVAGDFTRMRIHAILYLSSLLLLLMLEKQWQKLRRLKNLLLEKFRF